MRIAISVVFKKIKSTGHWQVTVRGLKKNFPTLIGKGFTPEEAMFKINQQINWNNMVDEEI